jgi:hypothetical protein
MSLSRDQLRLHVRRRKRIERAARKIDALAAAAAYVAFVGPGEDECIELELALGRLIALLDQHGVL